MRKLGKRQEQIYSYLCSYVSEHGYPPSVREIGEAVGLASPSTVHMHLHALQDLGYIHRDPKKPRALVLPKLVQDEGEQHRVENDNVELDVTILPVVGRVAAGLPILAEQNIEDRLAVPTSISSDSSSFILKVQGESMINAGIFDGDYVVVKEQHDARNGEIVIAMIDNECTVKRFFKESSYIRLQPENDTMKPIIAKHPTIIGKVTGLFRAVVS